MDDQRDKATRRPDTLQGVDKVPDTTSIGQLCRDAAKVLSKAGFEHRIDLYREVEIEDPTVRMMLGRGHRVKVRIKITASSLLFEDPKPKQVEASTEREQPETLPRKVANGRM